MAEQLKYLVTVDADTGTTLKLERIGEAGELVEVPTGTLSGAASAPVATPSMVYNIFIGGAAPSETTSRPASVSGAEGGASTQSVYPTCPGGHRKTVVGTSPVVVGNQAADSAPTAAQQAE